jgi:hypothetical protein
MGASLRAAADSGMVTSYRPAQHNKPAGLLQKVQQKIGKFFQKIPPSQTTQQGSTFAAPSAAYYELYSLRYERRAVISDCRQMYEDDPRCRRSVDMYVREAVRGGVTITVGSTARGVTGQRIAKAREVCKHVADLVNAQTEGASKVESWGRMAITEGDLFVQLVLSTDLKQLVEVMRMPASSMERNTDDMDQFVDMERAFSEVDVLTNAEVATYPRILIWHGRWRHVEGDRYGNPEMVAGRRFRNLLEMEEEAQVRRRLSRAARKTLWNVGTENKPGLPKHVEDWKEANGFVEGLLEQYDPVNIGWDYFANGLVSASAVEGDPGVSDIEDIRYFEDVYTNASLPTPSALFNLASKEVNRDVLEDVRAQWLLETQTLTDFLSACVRHLVNVALLLEGILPESVDFTVHFPESSIEKPSTIVDRTLRLFNNGHGAGNSFQWLPLITHRRAIQMIASFVDIDDVDTELAAIQTMIQQNDAQQLVKQAQQTQGKQTRQNARTEQREQAKLKAPNLNTQPPHIQALARAEGGRHNSSGTSDTSDTSDTNNGGTPYNDGLYAQNRITPGGAYTGIGQEASNYHSTYGEPAQQPEY